MGLRFTLESANTIANLTWGRIASCYDGIYSSLENYNNFLDFLNDFKKNIYSNEKEDILYDIDKIQKRIKQKGYHENKEEWNNEFKDNEFKDNDILKELHRLSLILNRCHIKSLLLPSFKNEKCNYMDDFMTERRTIDKLLYWHPGISCLIL